jgi:carbonic anhydrase
MPTEKLLHGHRAFRKMFSAEQEVFTRLAQEGQKPAVLWIGCSDSRVIPEQITGAGPGELFMMRNIANIVPPSGTLDGAVGAVIEYAVLHLQVAHIVICGHTECGGIKALEGHVNMHREPNISGWLELARPARAQVEALGLPEEERYLETIKRNVLLQRGNLLSYTCVQEGVNTGKLVVHCWLYDLHTGELLAFDDGLEKWKALDIP